MEKGPELDQLIAEKIFGWKVLNHWEPGVIKHLVDGNQCEVIPPEFKPYSNKISAAWEIVEEHSTLFKIEYDYISDMWSANFKRNDPEMAEQAETAPHAICLAALRLKCDQRRHRFDFEFIQEKRF